MVSRDDTQDWDDHTHDHPEHQGWSLVSLSRSPAVPISDERRDGKPPHHGMTARHPVLATRPQRQAHVSRAFLGDGRLQNLARGRVQGVPQAIQGVVDGLAVGLAEEAAEMAASPVLFHDEGARTDDREYDHAVDERIGGERGEERHSNDGSGNSKLPSGRKAFLILLLRASRH